MESVSVFLFLVARDGWDDILAHQQAVEVQIIKQIAWCVADDRCIGSDPIEFSNGAVNHGGDDVGVEFFPFEKVGDPEDEELAVEVILEAAERELFIGAGKQLEDGREMFFVEGERGFRDDDECIELGKGLSDEIDPGVVGVKARAEDVSALDEFAMPAVLAEGFFNSEDLAGVGAHGDVYQESGVEAVDSRPLMALASKVLRSRRMGCKERWMPEVLAAS